MPSVSRKKYRKIIMIVGSVALLLFVALVTIVQVYLEPVLRNRLNTLIVEGSDSLYTYSLKNLDANLFGGNVEVQGLRVDVDSNHYRRLLAKKSLPALTLQLNMAQGHIRGVGIFSLLFGKKVKVDEIGTRDAEIVLSRHIHMQDSVEKNRLPVWKAIQPTIKSISINTIRLEGIRMLYNDADARKSAILQFDRCDALLEDIKVDSAAAVDTSRIGFMKNVSFTFAGLRYVTSDSLYKLHAGQISYSSRDRKFQVDSFKIEPTMAKEYFSARDSFRRSLYTVFLKQVKFNNIFIDRFIRDDRIEADSILVVEPAISIYHDGTLPINYKSRIGKYPHQLVQNARSKVRIGNIKIEQLALEFIQKSDKTKKEGHISLQDVDMLFDNVTNDNAAIRSNRFCTVTATGKIFRTSPIDVTFRFYLDSTNGRFDMDGSIKNIGQPQLAPLALSMSNLEVRQLDVDLVKFHVEAEDFVARSDVQMLYRSIDLVFRKTDEETGETETKGFLSKIFKRYIIYPQNPGPDGIERVAEDVLVARLTTQSFFGLIWKAVYAGIQKIMMKSGSVE